MVDSVKNYGIAGVGANVELGKQGPKFVGNDSSQISLQDNEGNSTVIAVAEGTDASHAVTKDQLDAIVLPKVTVTTATVNYNDSNVSLGTLSANSTVLSVTVEKTTNWTDADSSTNIVVGDSGDVDRLFTAFDPTSQVTDETNHLYTLSTEVIATVTQGGASAGTAKVVMLHTGTVE